MRHRSSLAVVLTLLLSASPAPGAEATPPPTRSYAIPCKPSEMLRRHDALLALAAQVRADLAATAEPADPAALRKHHTTLFQVAILERDTTAAWRALARVRATQDAPAQKALSGLLTEPYLEARMSPGSDFHATYRERLARRLAALPFAEASYTLEATRGMMAGATADTMVGTARAALDPLVQDGRIPEGAAAGLISVAVNDELFRSVREDVASSLEALLAAHKADAQPYAPRVGVVRPPLRGAWFGIKPPGRTPERFAAAALDSVNAWCNGVGFSPDGKECFLGMGSPTYGGARVVHATCENGTWTPFTPPACLDGFVYTNEPHFSPDGRTLYFTGKRAGEQGRLWTTTRAGAGWGAPAPLPAAATGEGDAYRGTCTRGGTWYYGRSVRGMMQVYRATPGAGGTVTTEKLGPPISVEAYDGDPCVAPDGRWLVFYSGREGATRGADLYVSFPDGKGNWSEPVNLGAAFNTTSDEFGATLSPDARQLFFTRHTTTGDQVWWVDVAAIDALKPASGK